MRNEICRGARFAKSFAGLTTLAAMFTEIVATPTPNSASSATIARVAAEAISGAGCPGGVGEVSCARMNTGSHNLPVRRPRGCVRGAGDDHAHCREAIIVVGRPSV